MRGKETLKNLNDLIDITRGHMEFQRGIKIMLERFKVRLVKAITENNELEIQRIINDIDDEGLDMDYLA